MTAAVASYQAYEPTNTSSASSSTNPNPLHRSSANIAGNNNANNNNGKKQKKEFGDVVLELREIGKSFPIDDGKDIVHALKMVSISDELAAKGKGFPSIRQGEFIMIRGPSGGGKTTLLNMIGTIDLPTTGTLNLLGSEINKDSDDDFLSTLRLRHIGFVFQTFNLLSTMSALENVELPMTLLGELSEKERRSRAKKLLALVGLRNRIHHLPSELSGGEQQRVTIARSLANNPSILLLDEATGDLDTATTIQVMDLLTQINYMTGVTCIMVTHNPDIETYADRILYVEDGRFLRQVINDEPLPLVREEYEDYLKKLDNIPVSDTTEFSDEKQGAATQGLHNGEIRRANNNNSNKSGTETPARSSTYHYAEQQEDRGGIQSHQVKTSSSSGNNNGNFSSADQSTSGSGSNKNDDEQQPQHPPLSYREEERQNLESLFVRPPPGYQQQDDEKHHNKTSPAGRRSPASNNNKNGRRQDSDFDLPPATNNNNNKNNSEQQQENLPAWRQAVQKRQEHQHKKYHQDPSDNDQDDNNQRQRGGSKHVAPVRSPPRTTNGGGGGFFSPPPPSTVQVFPPPQPHVDVSGGKNNRSHHHNKNGNGRSGINFDDDNNNGKNSNNGGGGVGLSDL